MLPTLFVCVFGIITMVLTKVVPPPLRELDYLIIGSVSVLAAMLAVFVVAHRTMERPVLPLADEPRPTPRRRNSTSILDLNGGPDSSDPRP
jgi:hypothetical protein